MLTPELPGVIWNANRGALHFALHAWKAAHVGRQFEGVNAFERALPAVARLVGSEGSGASRDAIQHAPAAARNPF